ncbi:MAG TPA: UbiA family prenyltransferase [Conexibacter sp.]|nr:UbiA family prenyltransferase [Conexibacter sp.]
MSGGAVRNLRALLQCASCRFGALYYVPFCAGMAAAGTLSLATALLGAAFWLTLGMAIEVTNRLADRVEDAVNRPERTALCETVGWELLARVQLLLWGLVVVATAVWVALAPNALLLLLLVSGAGFGLAYSRGPRLARHRALVFVVLSGTFVGPFCLGVAAGDPLAGTASTAGFAQLGEFVPLFWVLTLFISSLAGIKDITDRAGDEAIGYRSAFVAFAERHGTAALTALAAVPFAALVGFVAAGQLPARALALLVFLPLSAGVALAVRGAHDRPADQLLVREALYDHWLAFTTATLLVCFPSLGLLAALAGAWLWWLVASRWLHWGAPLRLADLPRVVALATAGGARQRSTVPVPATAEANA